MNDLVDALDMARRAVSKHLRVAARGRVRLRCDDDAQRLRQPPATRAHRGGRGAGAPGRTVSCARPLPTEPSVDNPRPVEHHMIGTVTEGYGADWFGIAPHGYATSHLDALCHIFWDGQLYGGRPADVVTAHGATEARGPHARATGGRSRRAARRPGGARRRRARAGHADHGRGAGGCRGARRRPRGHRRRAARAHRAVALARRARAVGLHERLAGLHASCLPWLHEREIALLGSDGVSDVYPSHIDDVRLPIHTVGIVAMGLHLLDNLDLEALAAACAEEQRAEFLLTVAPLILRGGTASPVNPIATF